MRHKLFYRTHLYLLIGLSYCCVVATSFVVNVESSVISSLCVSSSGTNQGETIRCLERVSQECRMSFISLSLSLPPPLSLSLSLSPPPPLSLSLSLSPPPPLSLSLSLSLPLPFSTPSPFCFSLGIVQWKAFTALDWINLSFDSFYCFSLIQCWRYFLNSQHSCFFRCGCFDIYIYIYIKFF